jgi:hypothetical protein
MDVDQILRGSQCGNEDAIRVVGAPEIPLQAIHQEEEVQSLILQRHTASRNSQGTFKITWTIDLTKQDCQMTALIPRSPRSMDRF